MKVGPPQAAVSISNREYWDQQAEHYDSLYASSWSKREDMRVATLIEKLELPTEPVVLDIGCGTGLGLRQLTEAGVCCQYYGIDLSPKMLEKFDAGSSIGTTINLAVVNFAEYRWSEPCRPHLVMSIFGSLNFCEERWDCIARLADTQQAGDKIFLMLLAQYSLRRILRFDLGRQGEYRTRGSKSKNSVSMSYERPRYIKTRLRQLGYETLFLFGDGPMSGLCELSPIWQLNDFLGKKSPLFSHTIIVAGVKL